MFFEGSEKKTEIVFQKSLGSLRKKDLTFWQELVKRAKATILSHISNDHCDAYLLSESSLFVWDHRILMITCGGTTLIEAVKFLEEEFGKENFELLFYQRKNEFRSYEQQSSFAQDVEILRKYIHGKAMRFGKIHSHHNLIFHSDIDREINDSDTTTEILMYDICQKFCDELSNPSRDTRGIRDFLGFDKVLPGFKIDDYKFNPCGYSLNAIKDDKYYTIHVTPQSSHSYISFETNVDLKQDQQRVLNHVLEVMRPGAFDFISFNGTTTLDPKGYQKRLNYRDSLSCGYNFIFEYYYIPEPDVQAPFYF